MPRLAHHVYLEEPASPEATGPVLVVSAPRRGATALRFLPAWLLPLAFLVALLMVGRLDYTARGDLRQQELTRELHAVQRESARLELRLETLTSHAQLYARAKTRGYAYPDPAHTHTVRLARVPWEHEVKTATAPAPQTASAAVQQFLAGTVGKWARGPVASAVMPTP
jgi:hypothetical protein